MDASALEYSKENIQPLKQGRRTGQLGLALQAQTNAEIQQQLCKQRYNYELLIRMYEGDDPLEPRYDYVAWLEQTFPKHGPEANLVPLLEDTIATFKDDNRYKQDHRFAELIVKYIETQSNPAELYQMFMSQGLATGCAIFYKCWAAVLDCQNDFKRADEIFRLGFANNAEPREMLEQAHTQFQLSVGRRMLSGGLVEPTPEPQEQGGRLAFGKLKKNVGSVRLAHGLPGTVALSSASASSKSSKSNVPLVVYQENENEEQLVGVMQRCNLDAFPKSEAAHKENSMKPGTWKKGYNKKETATGGMAHLYQTPSTPSFKVHEDPDCSARTPAHRVSDVFSVLKTKRTEAFSCPMAIFEPPDPSVKPMYCKRKVYAGGREFQLEEIRAAIYNKRYFKKVQEEEMKRLGLPAMAETPDVFMTPMVDNLTRRRQFWMANEMTPFNTRGGSTPSGCVNETPGSSLCFTPAVDSNWCHNTRGTLQLGKLDFGPSEIEEDTSRTPLPPLQETPPPSTQPPAGPNPPSTCKFHIFSDEP